MNLIMLPEDVYTMVLLCMDTLSKLKFLEIIVDDQRKFKFFFTLQFFTPCELDKIFSNYSTLALSGCFNLMKLTLQLKPHCKFNSDVCANAAKLGHLEILQWVRAQNPPCHWNATTCIFAVKYGHLEILQWLRSQNPPCPWNKDVCDYAAQSGHLEILQWLRSQNPPCPWDKNKCMRFARDYANIVQWIREN